MTSFQEYFSVFEAIKKEIGGKLKKKHGLIVKTALMEDEGCAFFKLFKREWTTSPDSKPSNNGVFFSIWVQKSHIKRKRVMYNIHALELHELRNYDLNPKQFSEQFASRIPRKVQGLPNIAINRGPKNLIWGHIDTGVGELHEKCMPLITMFTEIYPVIDGLLSQNKKN